MFHISSSHKVSITDFDLYTSLSLVSNEKRPVLDREMHTKDWFPFT